MPAGGASVGVAGAFRLESRDAAGRLLGVRVVPNGTTTAGCDHASGVMFKGAAKKATWYVGLVADAGFSALSAADTASAHPGWAEYVGVAARPAWACGTPAAGQLASAAPSFAPVTASGTVRGAFLTTSAVPGVAAPGDVLFCTAAADSGLPVVAGGTVTITYLTRGAPGAD